MPRPLEFGPGGARRMVELYDEGLSLRQVAKRMGCCHRTVAAYLEREDTPRREPYIRHPWVKKKAPEGA